MQITYNPLIMYYFGIYLLLGVVAVLVAVRHFKIPIGNVLKLTAAWLLWPALVPPMVKWYRQRRKIQKRKKVSYVKSRH